MYRGLCLWILYRCYQIHRLFFSFFFANSQSNCAKWNFVKPFCEENPVRVALLLNDTLSSLKFRKYCFFLIKGETSQFVPKPTITIPKPTRSHSWLSSPSRRPPFMVATIWAIKHHHHLLPLLLLPLFLFTSPQRAFLQLSVTKRFQIWNEI